MYEAVIATDYAINVTNVYFLYDVMERDES